MSASTISSDPCTVDCEVQGKGSGACRFTSSCGTGTNGTLRRRRASQFANAAFDVAATTHPSERLMLRQGIRHVRKHEP